MVSEKIPPEKSSPWGVRGRVRVRLGIGLGLGSQEGYPGNFFQEPDLYSKPTDTQQYFHAQSCHSDVRKRFIAYGQLVGFKRIFSTEEKLNNHLKQLKHG